MDSEEEKVLYLSRVGRDKIFKYGTYTIMQERPITQDHPFYEKRDPGQKISYLTPEQLAAHNQGLMQPGAAVAPSEATPEPSPAAGPEPVGEEDAAALAAQMISSNFKVGLSQDEVDALLNGMN